MFQESFNCSSPGASPCAKRVRNPVKHEYLTHIVCDRGVSIGVTCTSTLIACVMIQYQLSQSQAAHSSHVTANFGRVRTLTHLSSRGSSLSTMSESCLVMCTTWQRKWLQTIVRHHRPWSQLLCSRAGEVDRARQSSRAHAGQKPRMMSCAIRPRATRAHCCRLAQS